MTETKETREDQLIKTIIRCRKMAEARTLMVKIFQKEVLRSTIMNKMMSAVESSNLSEKEKVPKMYGDFLHTSQRLY